MLGKLVLEPEPEPDAEPEPDGELAGRRRMMMKTPYVSRSATLTESR
jgi:hypothetical protein